MDINVTMASGELDSWDADDALVQDHYLLIVAGIESDEVPDTMKTVTVTEYLDNPAPPPREEAFSDRRTLELYTPAPRGTKTRTYQLLGQYAPGMWIKVEYPA